MSVRTCVGTLRFDLAMAPATGTSLLLYPCMTLTLPDGEEGPTAGLGDFLLACWGLSVLLPAPVVAVAAARAGPSVVCADWRRLAFGLGLNAADAPSRAALWASLVARLLYEDAREGVVLCGPGMGAYSATNWPRYHRRQRSILPKVCCVVSRNVSMCRR